MWQPREVAALGFFPSEFHKCCMRHLFGISLRISCAKSTRAKVTVAIGQEEYSRMAIDARPSDVRASCSARRIVRSLGVVPLVPLGARASGHS